VDYILLSDEQITVQKVQNIDFLNELIRLDERIRKIRSNEKVSYIINLFKNVVYLPKDPDYDEYDEYLTRLIDLSDREIHVLFLLSKKRTLPEWQNERGSSIRDNQLWKMFLSDAEEELKLDKEMIDTIVSGISRTGFCKQKVAPDRGKNNVVYEVSPYFERLISILTKEYNQPTINIR
jgi:hypothetical protein